MTSQASAMTDAVTKAKRRRGTTVARSLALAALLTTGLAACSTAAAAPSGSSSTASASASQTSQAQAATANGPASTIKNIPNKNYPGAAALVSKAHFPVEPILPPPAKAHSDMPKYWTDQCLDSPAATAQVVCSYGDTKNPVLTVAMVGGSTDGNWFAALDEIALARHWKLVTDLHGTCEWTDTMLVEKGGDKYTACFKWGQSVLKTLETKVKPDVVIAGGYPEDGTVANPVAASPASNVTIAAGEAKYWTSLEKHGISVVAMRETPIPDYSLADCIVKHGRHAAACTVPRSKAILANPPNVLAAKDTGGKVPVINMNKYLCGPKVCGPVYGNILVYFDGRHLTASYSRSTVKYLLPLLLKAAPVLAKK